MKQLMELLKYKMIIFRYVVASALFLLLTACVKAKEIDLPNNCVITLNSDGKVIVLSEGNSILGPNVQGFMVEGSFFYGWLDDPKVGLKFFALNTVNKKVRDFSSLDDLNGFLAFWGLPLLEMSKERTYWDIVKE